MSKDKPVNETSASAEGYTHPCPTHDQDQCVVEVVYPKGVVENGNTYRQGEQLVLPRRHANSQNKPGRPVYRVVRTLKYVNDPTAVSTAIGYEEEVDEGPLKIS